MKVACLVRKHASLSAASMCNCTAEHIQSVACWCPIAQDEDIPHPFTESPTQDKKEGGGVHHLHDYGGPQEICSSGPPFFPCVSSKVLYRTVSPKRHRRPESRASSEKPQKKTSSSRIFRGSDTLTSADVRSQTPGRWRWPSCSSGLLFQSLPG